MAERYLERINYEGDLADPLRNTADMFELGRYKSYTPIEVGYEDYNVRLDTSAGSYFVKFFFNDRPDKECERYVRVMNAVIDAGVHHPKLYSATSGELFKPPDTNLRLVVMEWLDGQSFFDLREQPSDSEVAELSQQATLINETKLELNDNDFVYDSWAINNMVQEYAKWQHVFTDADKLLIQPVLEAYQSLDVTALPHAFVHGDLIRTNVMKTPHGLYVFDFAVANNYPRIQELAVLLCDMFFVSDDVAESKRLYELAVAEYQKHTSLTQAELEVLPTFVRAAHAMHVLGGARGQAKGDGGDENNFWWERGRAGLNMGIYDS